MIDLKKSVDAGLEILRSRGNDHCSLTELQDVIQYQLGIALNTQAVEDIKTILKELNERNCPDQTCSGGMPPGWIPKR